MDTIERIADLINTTDNSENNSEKENNPLDVINAKIDGLEQAIARLNEIVNNLSKEEKPTETETEEKESDS